MKILYILSEYLPDSGGGIISHYARILPELVARGHGVKVLVANHGSLDRAARELDGVEVEYLQSQFAEEARVGCRKFRNDALWAFLPLAWGAFHQTNGGEGFEIVEATDWGLLFVPWVVSERKAKVVVSLHGSNGQVDWFSNPGRQNFESGVVRLVEVAALPLADAIHANSRANAEFWRAKLRCDIRVIPPAYVARSAPEDGVTTKDTKGHEREEEFLTTDDTDGHRYDAGHCLGKPSGAVFSNLFTSELARDSENTSPTRSAIGPALAAKPPITDGGGSNASEDGRSKIRDRGIGSDGGNQSADSMEFLESQSQAGLQMDTQKHQSPREASDLGSSGNDFHSVSIREIRGQGTSAASHAASYSPPVTAPELPLLDSRPSSLDAPGLVVGRLQNWKGAEGLCRALRLAPGIEIEWVGGDTDWGSSGQNASEYLAANYPDVFGKRLRWIGRLDRVEVSMKMHAAGFLVVPSIWDVFNLTAAEGMEVGLPVVCSRAAGAEMLIKHGKNGFLFDPAKPEELAECLKIVAGMSMVETIEMGKMAQESVKNVLDGEKIIHLLEESYRTAMHNNKPTRNEPWLASLFSPDWEPEKTTSKNFVQRAIRKIGGIFANA